VTAAPGGVNIETDFLFRGRLTSIEIFVVGTPH
jgi:hypothetical protein